MSNVKLNTKINSFADVQKSLQSIEKYLNELSKSVNATAEKDISDKDGKTGDIKTTRNADGTYTFEVRTEEGWKTPSLGDSFVKFKDKNASFSQNKLESIDEIERVDTNTGDSRANLTTFDEKNNKFIMPRPDYDSGWFEIVRNRVYITGGTTGAVPSGKAGVFASTAGNNVGIPELGFKIKRPFTKLQIIYGPSGTTSFAEGLETGFIMFTDVGQSVQHYSSGAMSNFIAIMSEDHLCFSTADQWLLHMRSHGGLDIYSSTDGHNFQTNAGCKIRIWK